MFNLEVSLQLLQLGVWGMALDIAVFTVWNVALKAAAIGGCGYLLLWVSVLFTEWLLFFYESKTDFADCM